ncbi:MAG: J domain-containing protein [Thermomicrobiales bacterium]|nr:J domain-containing protein [Thermomicrobiales bacterium]MCO5223643.1 J domain-containing protein [Thermomicrobiales bacterium]
MSNVTTGQLDYYKILGVSYQASPQEIKRAYRAAMKRSHPDRMAPELRADAELLAQELNEAYRVLSKPETRERYDTQLKSTMIQDQIMSRYSGGLGAPGADQDIYARIREAKRIEQRNLQKQSDRAATTSLLVVFVGFALIVLILLILGSIVASIVSRLVGS